MLFLYQSLSEKDRRRYAAIEAVKLGHGGITYICSIFSCDDKTVRKGLVELQDKKSMDKTEIRAPGGGRTPKLELFNNIDEPFLEILKDHTAGSPMDSRIKWTNLSRKEIAAQLQKKGFDVSRKIVKKLLSKHGFVRRKLQKKSHRKE